MSLHADVARENARQADGKFGTQVHDETALDLTPQHVVYDTLVDDDRNWGTVGIGVGSNTPWGAADNVDKVADGIVFASTPSHGGYKLSPERNKAIPAPLRNSGGWYEEDLEGSIVAMYHDVRAGSDQNRDAVVAEAHRMVRNYMPLQYAAATGTVVELGESTQGDVNAYREMHAGEWALTNRTHTSPDGTHYAELSQITVGDLPQKKWVAMSPEQFTELRTRPREDFFSAPGWQLPVTVPDIYSEVPDPRERSRTIRTVPDYSGATTSARRRIQADLDKRWRGHDGKIQTLRELVEQDGLTGKTVTVNGKIRTYSLLQQDPSEPSTSYSLKVTRDTWEAFVDVPDERSERQKSYQRVQIAEAKMEALRKTATWSPERRAEFELAQREYRAVANEHRLMNG